MGNARFCPQCGKESLEGNTFCAQCGAPLNQQAPPPQPPPRTPEQRAAEWGWNRPSSNNSSAKGCLIAAGVILGLFVLCGIVGSLEDKNVGTRAPSTSAPPANSNSVPTPTPSPLSPAESLARAKQMTGEGASRAELGQAVDMLSSIPKGAKEYREAQPLLEKTRNRWARLAAEQLVLGPKPENYGWNGKVFCVDQYLKRTLNDYDSAEYLEWSPVTRMDVKGEPYWAVRLKLRAKNAFGAFIVKDVVFFIRQNEVVNAVGL